ncbi:MAG: hypothetical protein VZT48_12570, partial [Bulleidia sp.]|nr:hypothetical protein [Bulleidia sp.]
LRIQSENEKTVYLYSSKDTVGVRSIDDPANDLNRKMKKFRNFYDRLKTSMISAWPPLIPHLKEWDERRSFCNYHRQNSRRMCAGLQGQLWQ